MKFYLIAVKPEGGQWMWTYCMFHWNWCRMFTVTVLFVMRWLRWRKNKSGILTQVNCPVMLTEDACTWSLWALLKCVEEPEQMRKIGIDKVLKYTEHWLCNLDFFLNHSKFQEEEIFLYIYIRKRISILLCNQYPGNGGKSQAIRI